MPTLSATVQMVLAQAATVYKLEPQTEVSVVLTDDTDIQQLNCQYRGKDRPTDVLSFALNEGDEPDIFGADAAILIGDIIISVETAARQAAEYGHSLEREVAYLALHGMLHLLGYDHETETDKAEMRAEEEHVLAELGIGR